jgi:hypothetical protein
MLFHRDNAICSTVSALLPFPRTPHTLAQASRMTIASPQIAIVLWSKRHLPLNHSSVFVPTQETPISARVAEPAAAKDHLHPCPSLTPGNTLRLARSLQISVLSQLRDTYQQPDRISMGKRCRIDFHTSRQQQTMPTHIFRTIDESVL